jgi:hypothetical protein
VLESDLKTQRLSHKTYIHRVFSPCVRRDVEEEKVFPECSHASASLLHEFFHVFEGNQKE